MKALHHSLLLLAVLGAQAGAAQHLIENANVIPMTGEVVLEGHSVLIRNGLIAAVCAPGARCGDGSAETIDGTGKFLIPGLIDMHAHTNPGDLLAMEVETREMTQRVQSQQLRQYVMFGVTTLRDTAGGPANLEIRERIERGEAIGPRIFTAFGAMDGDPPLHAATTPFATGEEAATYVFNTAAAGYDFVKIYSTLPQPVFDAIIEAAGEVGLPVVGHVPMPIDIEYALQRGMRSIEHLSGYDVSCAGPEAGIEPIMDDVYQGMNYCTPEKIRQLAEMTTRYDAWNCPHAHRPGQREVRMGPPHRLQRRGGPLHAADAAHLPGVSLRHLPAQGPRRAQGRPDPADGAGQGAERRRRAPAPRYRHRRVRLQRAPGTGAAGRVRTHALPGADRGHLGTGALLRARGRVRTIVPGGSADLVLLDANPLEDVANARGIAGVMVRGDWWPRPRIEKELAAIQDEYARDAEILARQSIGEVP